VDEPLDYPKNAPSNMYSDLAVRLTQHAPDFFRRSRDSGDYWPLGSIPSATYDSKEEEGFGGRPRLRFGSSTFWRFLRSLHLTGGAPLLTVQTSMRQRVWETANVQ